MFFKGCRKLLTIIQLTFRRYWLMHIKNLNYGQQRPITIQRSVFRHRYYVIIVIITMIIGMFILSDWNNEPISEFYGESTDEPSPIWTRISDSLHIYSAHLDPRIKAGPFTATSLKQNLTLIRIIGIKRFPPMRQIVAEDPYKWLRIKDEAHFGENYTCKLFIQRNDEESLTSFSAEILTIQVIEEGIKEFASCFFNCYFNSSIFPQVFSAYVALYPKKVPDYPDKLVKVEISPKAEKSPSTLSICTRPIFSPMDPKILPNLMQFLSYYVAVGVTKFNFYDFAISPQVRKYLTLMSHFRGKRKFHVVLQKWNLSTGNTSELWDYGSLAALNDCMYRNMGSGHVLFLDLDEFIVPQKKEHGSLGNLINYLERKENRTSPSQILFRNTFFCREFCPKAPHLSKTDGDFDISTCTTRTKRVWNVKLRSKFLVNPGKIISVGHHTAHNFWSGADKNVKDNRLERSITANVDEALLNHYRECRSINSKALQILNRLIMEDTHIQRVLKRQDFQWLDFTFIHKNIN